MEKIDKTPKAIFTKTYLKETQRKIFNNLKNKTD